MDIYQTIRNIQSQQKLAFNQIRGVLKKGDGTSEDWIYELRSREWWRTAPQERWGNMWGELILIAAQTLKDNVNHKP